tara:strand:+ start:98 stop:313 length:216 start_codon:yes stop_codon:yes gene_type:complete
MSHIYKNLPVDIQEIIDKEILDSNPYEESLISELNNYFYEKRYKYSNAPYNVYLPSVMYLIGEVDTSDDDY